MADFCTTCSKDVWGPSVGSDFKLDEPPTDGQLELELTQFQDNIRQVLCEGCGVIWVNRDGDRIDPEVVKLIQVTARPGKT